jgi:ribonuclease P protein component
MPARLIHKADFERLMSAPTWSRSAHFALHHLSRGPAMVAGRKPRSSLEEISTDLPPVAAETVDNKPERVWAGAMVPKRHARRAVTRNLLKRQIRQAFERHEALLPKGLWLVRLRRVFAPADYTSARSALLAEAARRELDELLRRPRPGRVAG